jgi:hypothetical protein
MTLIDISIRLGFLAIEFSGGFVLDFIRCFINNLLEKNPYNKHDKKKEKKINHIISENIIIKLAAIRLVYQRTIIVFI